jgi:hypothetical protein
MVRYCCCVLLAGSISWDQEVSQKCLSIRLMEKPIAVPQATGSSMAAAGFSNRKVGSVSEGM